MSLYSWGLQENKAGHVLGQLHTFYNEGQAFN